MAHARGNALRHRETTPGGAEKQELHQIVEIKKVLQKTKAAVMSEVTTL
ncbi:hypothetical protein N9L76_06045 [bacterium]|nr:hypothetical protein [bacterium]